MKLATSHLRTPVAPDSKSIQLYVDADDRLAAAVGGAARYLAGATELQSDAVEQWQKSIVAACQEAFANLTGDHPQLAVTLTRFADRIEVALSHEGEAAPAVGLDRIAGFANHLGGLSSAAGILNGIDRVQYEMHGGSAVTRLTKYFGKAPRIA